MLKAVALPRMLNPIVRRGWIVSVQHLVYRTVQRRIPLFIYQVQNGISVRSHLLAKLRAIPLLDEHQARGGVAVFGIGDTCNYLYLIDVGGGDRAEVKP